MMDIACATSLITPRIGIVKSAEHPLRYLIAENPFVSGPRCPLRDGKSIGKIRIFAGLN